MGNMNQVSLCNTMLVEPETYAFEELNDTHVDLENSMDRFILLSKIVFDGILIIGIYLLDFA